MIYLGEFDSSKEHPLIHGNENYDGFRVSSEVAEEIKKLDIICAAYHQEDYSGEALVLFRKNGKLYEVNESHCSCNGLDNWEPEETTKESLLKRSEEFGVWKYYGKELKKIIMELDD